MTKNENIGYCDYRGIKTMHTDIRRKLAKTEKPPSDMMPQFHRAIQVAIFLAAESERLQGICLGGISYSTSRLSVTLNRPS